MPLRPLVLRVLLIDLLLLITSSCLLWWSNHGGCQGAPLPWALASHPDVWQPAVWWWVYRLSRVPVPRAKELIAWWKAPRQRSINSGSVIVWHKKEITLWWMRWDLCVWLLAASLPADLPVLLSLQGCEMTGSPGAAQSLSAVLFSPFHSFLFYLFHSHWENLLPETLFAEGRRSENLLSVWPIDAVLLCPSFPCFILRCTSVLK